MSDPINCCFFSKRRFFFMFRHSLICCMAFGLAWCTLEAVDSSPVEQGEKVTSAAPSSLDSVDMLKLSEAFGHFIGRNLQSPGLKFDVESLIKGIREGALGTPSPLSDKEYEEMMAAVQDRAFKEISTNNLKAAEDFLTKNLNESGVIEVVPAKLQYIVMQEGKGPVVEAHASPKVHYTGKYQDGTVFGSSEETGGPIVIPLDQTIPGFSKGIVGMKEGEKRRLFVHPDLGYGTTGQLPPNELLIFEVEVFQADSEEGKEEPKEGVEWMGEESVEQAPDLTVDGQVN